MGKKEASVIINCVRAKAVVVDDGTTLSKPLLAGFAKASDLERLAKAPSFSESDPNQSIAEMLQKRPIRKWQRPLDTARIAEMAGFFSAGGHVMPNPVLLAQNPDVSDAVTVSPHGDMVRVELHGTPRALRDGALWILDGQHRIKSLAQSAQKNNPIPFVLLLDEGGSYSKAEFAAIFAQVTTRAMPLEEPHHTWLEYSFELGSYEKPTGDAKSKAFETIVWLGSDEEAEGTKTKNRFAGNIRFNPRFPDKTTKVGVEGIDGVFAFPAQDFSRVVHEHYFKKPPKPAMKPRDLAAQIALAYAALRDVVPQPQTDAVLFKPENAYIQEGYIVGVLSYLRVRGAPTAWVDVLQKYGFDQDSWEFLGRQITTGGEHGRPSRSAAIGAFQHVFGQDRLPPGAPHMVSYLLGDTATTVRVLIFDTAAGGPPITTIDIRNQRNVTLKDALKAGRSLRIELSPNIGALRLQASTRTPAYWSSLTKKVRSRNGFELDDLATDLAAQGSKGAVTLTVWFELYGGDEASTNIIFS